MVDRPLTPTEVTVLQAASRGELYRSDSIKTLYESYIRSGRLKVTKTVERLTSRTEQLLSIGEREGFTRPWHLTEAGKAELARHPEES